MAVLPSTGTSLESMPARRIAGIVDVMPYFRIGQQLSIEPTVVTESVTKPANKAFDCGHAALNEYLRRYACQNHESGGAKTFVASSSSSSKVAMAAVPEYHRDATETTNTP